MVALITELQKTNATLTKKLEAYENQARIGSRNGNGGSEQAEKKRLEKSKAATAAVATTTASTTATFKPS